MVPPKLAQYVSASVVMMTPSSPTTIPFTVTSAPLQTALMTFSLISTTLQGSPAVFVPLYFQPFEPAGLPRPIHVPADAA